MVIFWLCFWIDCISFLRLLDGLRWFWIVDIWMRFGLSRWVVCLFFLIIEVWVCVIVGFVWVGVFLVLIVLREMFWFIVFFKVELNILCVIWLFLSFVDFMFDFIGNLRYWFDSLFVGLVVYIFWFNFENVLLGIGCVFDSCWF